jgi:hypothetical protein
MNIVLSEETNTNHNLLSVTTDTWQAHPLRTTRTDKLLEEVTLVVEEGEAYGLNPDRHPEYRLICAPNSPYTSVPLYPAIIHELTHMIDRFDLQFIGERSPEEARQLIDSIPRGNANEAISRAFFNYWNAYIDGRLSRRGIIVETFERRLEEKLTSRKNTEYATQGEIDSLWSVWDSETQTLDGLMSLARTFPSRRHPRYRIAK